MRAYAGIGSRETPREVLDMMRRLAAAFAREGLTLRSGGAPGADAAFEEGCDAVKGHKEIYLPWRGFNGNTSPRFGVSANALHLAAQFHPNWRGVSNPARCLHSRNGYQILGRDLQTPAAFVICWTKDGEATGGTGQALRIAQRYGVTIHNLQRPDEWEKAQAFLRVADLLNFDALPFVG